MSSPAPFSDLLAANKLMEGAIAGLIQNLNSRIDILQKKQEDDAATARTNATTKHNALGNAIQCLKKDVALITDITTKLSNANVDLANRLTSIQSGMTQVERMVTDLGQQYSDSEVQMNRDIEKIAGKMEIFVQDHNTMKGNVTRLQQFYEGMSTLSVGIAPTEHSVSPCEITPPKRLPPLRTSSLRSTPLPDQSPPIPRAVSLGIQDGIPMSPLPGLHMATALKPSITERHSEQSLHYKRSGSLLRKRGRSDLRRDSRETVRERGNITPGGRRTGSRLNNAFTPTYSESDEEFAYNESDSELLSAFN